MELGGVTRPILTEEERKMKNVIGYVRVSSERQAGDDRVSIDQQKNDISALAKMQDFNLVQIYEDKERYLKTKPPLKGKRVEPSGKYDDRPGFMAMLDHLEQGNIDAVIYWDNYRLGRHFRVLGTLANSLDIAARNRSGKPEIELWEASKRTAISRIFLGIMISIAQEENEAKTRRVKMGRIGTLQQGRWPGEYRRYGYNTVKEPGKRGVAIVLNPQEADVVQLIFDLADKGNSLLKIRKELISQELGQKRNIGRKRIFEWSEGVINNILRSEDYTGKATYNFSDGQSYTIEIPQIIALDQWKRVQKKITERIKASPRNTIADWNALQSIVVCGDCGRGLTVSSKRVSNWIDAKGIKHQWAFDLPVHSYRCSVGARQQEELPHKQLSHYGPNLDYQVWRFLVDNVIEHPELIREQVLARRAVLQRQGDNYDGEIAQAKRKLTETEAGRERLMTQLRKGVITEADFEKSMLGANDEQNYWQEKIADLESMRDDAAKIQSDLEFAYHVLETYQEQLPELDKTPEEFKALDREQRLSILYRRKRIIKSLCEKVTVWGDGRVLIDGLIDSNKADLGESLPGETGGGRWSTERIEPSGPAGDGESWPASRWPRPVLPERGRPGEGPSSDHSRPGRPGEKLPRPAPTRSTSPGF